MHIEGSFLSFPVNSPSMSESPESGQKCFLGKRPRAVAEATQPRCALGSPREGGLVDCGMQRAGISLAGFQPVRAN